MHRASVHTRELSVTRGTHAVKKAVLHPAAADPGVKNGSASLARRFVLGIKKCQMEMPYGYALQSTHKRTRVVP